MCCTYLFHSGVVSWNENLVFVSISLISIFIVQLYAAIICLLVVFCYVTAVLTYVKRVQVVFHIRDILQCEFWVVSVSYCLVKIQWRNLLKWWENNTSFKFNAEIICYKIILKIVWIIGENIWIFVTSIAKPYHYYYCFKIQLKSECCNLVCFEP